jgi:hypothetical protein
MTGLLKECSGVEKPLSLKLFAQNEPFSRYIFRSVTDKKLLYCPWRTRKDKWWKKCPYINLPIWMSVYIFLSCLTPTARHHHTSFIRHRKKIFCRSHTKQPWRQWKFFFVIIFFRVRVTTVKCPNININRQL